MDIEAVRALHDVKEQIRVDGRLRIRIDGHGKSREPSQSLYLFDIELQFRQRQPRGIAPDPEPADKCSISVRLMLVGIEHSFRDLRHDLLEGQCVPYRCTQRQEIDAMTDQGALLDLRLTCKRHPDDNVGFAREPVDQRLEPGKQGREKRGAVVLPHVLDLAVVFGRDMPAQRVTGITADRSARVIRWQIDRRGDILEFGGPVRIVGRHRRR